MFLSSLSHPSKLIKPKEGVIETSIWQVSHLPVTTRTFYRHLEVEGLAALLDWDLMLSQGI